MKRKSPTGSANSITSADESCRKSKPISIESASVSIPLNINCLAGRKLLTRLAARIALLADLHRRQLLDTAHSVSVRLRLL